MDAYDRSLALEADRSTLYPPTVASKSPRRCSLRRPVSVRWRSRSRDRNARSERLHGLCVIRGGHADDVMAKTASLRHIFVIQLFTLAAAVRPPSEARGAEAWDRAQTALRQVRMYDTMLSGYSMLSTTSHTLELLPCASVDGRDMRSSVPQKASKML